MYRNVLFRAIIDGMQWGGARRGSWETAETAQRGERVMGQARTRPASDLLADESLVEGPQMLTLLFKDLSK